MTLERVPGRLRPLDFGAPTVARVEGPVVTDEDVETEQEADGRLQQGRREAERRRQAQTTPRALPTLVNAATARSMCSGRWPAEIWTRIRDWPFGTTG